MKKYHTIILITLSIVILSTGVIYISTNKNLLWRLDIIYQNPSPLVRHFSPTWRSLKRIGDLYYFPQTLFHTSSLPLYEVTLGRGDIQELIDALPRLEGGKPFFTEENKQSIKGEFRAGNYEAEVHIRNRGILPNHWSARKKSWHINFPKEDLFNGRQTVRLFIPEDRWWATEFLEAYRARKLGVLTPNLTFVRLTINGKDEGVYLDIEGWDQSFLNANERDGGDIFSEYDTARQNDYLRSSAFNEWEARINPLTHEYDNALKDFLFIISDTTNEEFARRIPTILNMEKMYGWLLESLLARNYHVKNIGNLNFYYDPTSGLFEPIAYDMFSRDLGDTFSVEHNRLSNRILQHKPFRNEFEQYTQTYVGNMQNLLDDLSYFDAVTENIAYDIMSDTAKLPPTSDFFAYHKNHRTVIIANFLKIRMWLRAGEIPITFADEIYPLSNISP